MDPKRTNESRKARRYIYRLTGEWFDLEIVPNDPHGRTHHLRNERHTWEGSQDEFLAAFLRL